MMTDMEEVEVKKIQLQIDKHDTNEVEVNFSEVASKLVESLLNIEQLPLEQVQKEFTEITNKQETLLRQMQIENKKFHEICNKPKLIEMFQTIELYQGKLNLMRKEMISVHERIFKLKKRARMVKQIKQKVALNRERQREQEVRREQELIGYTSHVFRRDNISGFNDLK
ncbi:biogenesis of lysosomal organelles complex 1 subunit pallidin isoform X1 [Megachile rotundata]|uniref:biogenesis of lysosomal organelles complex 1 subunit pallidin isoform X1 n=1 Tax=Megachile rotundata TaxID=143995 RepID=UPI000614A89E|nr:PREDICTED: biogenesis of lysosome-related organelles complex 1 subunit 6-like isoform X2 [Megachile rotundata]